jgi:hypothetical protein
MIVVDYKQFHALRLPIAREYRNRYAMDEVLINKYGIQSMYAHENSNQSSWDIYFVNDNAELLFKLKYSEYL